MTKNNAAALDPPFLWTRWAGPVGGTVFAVLWLVGEAGRWQLDDRPFAFLMIGAAIAIAPFLPMLALSSLVAVPVLQLLGLIARPTADDWPVSLGFAIVLFLVALRHERRLRIAALGVGVFCAAATSVLLGLKHRLPALLGTYVNPELISSWDAWTGTDLDRISLLMVIASVALLVLAGGWATGAAMYYLVAERSTRRILIAAERELAASETARLLAVQRQTIAGDVHDVLAHSLTVIIAQLDGAVASGADHPALDRVSTIARESLVDVRALVERLDQGETSEVAPSLDDLEALIGRVAEAGLRVEFRESGERPELADGLQLTVLRILQESLTNALKHRGRGATASVGLDWRGDQLVLRVFSSGGDLAESAEGRAEADIDSGGGASPGVGIGSMQTRARMAGGWLTAEPDGEDFVVTAVLPQRVVAEAVLR